ncbi:MAG: DNA methylase [Bacilli bacterium]|nr:DNA methylase [Bacilli bacterium]
MKYACVDLKSFYASCECVERGLDPLNTNLVVADSKRTEKTICLAVTPSLKRYGLNGRSRLYEVLTKIKEINELRKKKNKAPLSGKSYLKSEIDKNNNLEVDFIIAPPKMAKYMEYSNKIYNIYLKYLSKDDIFVYSIDEVFCDLTNYLKYYKKTAEELITMIINDIYKTTGITATAGIGENLYLAKIAMDIVAKHKDANKYGVRIAYLDEMKYRKLLWNHEPITDFWRVGVGISNRLKENGMYTMGDVALNSIKNEDLLYSLFGINAELLIDHAWGYEPCTIKDIKSYVPTTTSLSKGQVLTCPYIYKDARLVTREMVELLTLEMVEKNYITDTLVLTIGYDIENLKRSDIKTLYSGEYTKDHYGRTVPKQSHGTIRINHKTSSTKIITEHFIALFDRIANPLLLVRRINIAVANLEIKEEKKERLLKQFSLFDDFEKVDTKIKKEKEDEITENKIQKVIINIKNKYGKNSILKGMNLEHNATTIERNKQIGGHRSE